MLQCITLYFENKRGQRGVVDGDLRNVTKSLGPRVSVSLDYCVCDLAVIRTRR